MYDSLKNLIEVAIKFADSLGWSGGREKGKEEVLEECSLHGISVHFLM